MSESLEDKLQQIKDDFMKSGKTEEEFRFALAVSLGYFPAWKVAELYQTYGVHPADIISKLREVNLKLDWGGLKAELVLEGMKESAADSLIEEAQFFEREINETVIQRTIR